MKNKLADVYSPEKFKEYGYELIDLITKHLKATQNEEVNANNWKRPAEQLDFWKNYNIDNNSPTAFFEDVIKRSINVQHPKYMGHQICPPAPLSALSGLLNSILNNGMAIYEMGPAATAIEKVVIDTINEKIGYNKEADGFITSGGTLANLTALLSARKAMVESDIWTEGMNEDLAVMVSSEAHYCVDRSLRIMGFGSKGIIKVPVGKDFSMQTKLLEECYSKATAKGLKVISVVGSAPSTSTGIYDDLEAIGEFCKSKKLWFHVDGAHGGAVIFSEKYKHLVKGLQEADSVVIDGHKMLMTPSIMTFLLFKNKNHSYATFSQKAQYLWGKDQEEEWYNLAKRTFECTKHMMSIQFYIILKFYGEEIFDQFVTHLYDLGHYLANLIKTKRTNFELAVEPHSNIVCFRYKPEGHTEEELNKINSAIRQNILEENQYYIVQTTLNSKVYLRVTFMNPHTSEKIIDSMLDKVEELSMGQDLVPMGHSIGHDQLGQQGFHVVLTTHNSRTSKRMIKYGVRKGRPIHLGLEEEIALTEIIGNIIKENGYLCVEYNICKDHVHLLLVCKQRELTGIVQKIKSISSKLFHRLNISMGHDPLEHKGHLWSQKFFRADLDVWKLATISDKPGYINGSTYLGNAIRYIHNNRIKHELPDSEKLKKTIESFLTSVDKAFSMGHNPLKKDPLN